jgi:hypothetical protein
MQVDGSKNVVLEQSISRNRWFVFNEYWNCHTAIMLNSAEKNY